MCEFNGTKLNKDQYVLLTGCKVKGENALYKVTRDIANDENYSGDNGYLLEKVKLNGEIKTSGYTLYFYDNNGIKYDPQVTAKPLNNVAELKEANKELKAYLISRDNKTIVNKINETNIKIDLNAVGTEYKVKMINQVKFSTNGYNNNKAFKKDQYFKIKVIEGQRIRTELLNKTCESYCFDTAMKYSHSLNTSLTQKFINNCVVIEIDKITKESLKEIEKEIKKEEVKPVEVAETSEPVQEISNTQENQTTNNDSIEFTVSEDIHTKTGAKIFVAKLTKKVEYEEFKTIENKIKSIGGYYSRFKKGFIFSEYPTQLLKDTFDNSESKETAEQQNTNIINIELKEVEPIEINIDNINAENFPISKEISQRENNGHWIFRTKERNHQQEILNYLQSFQDTFINELNKLNDNIIINSYKRWLNSFKKRYYDNYYKKLRNDADNPSWITTGRDGRSASKDRKYTNRYDNLMKECCSLDEEFKKKLGEVKVKIRKENDKKFAEAVLSNKKEYEYKRVKKSINMGTVNNYFEGNNLVEKNCYMTTVDGQEFYIINVWSRFVAVNSKGQEIGKASCQTLKDCKVILNYYLAEYEKSEQIAM
jgi:hypothetical protein